eukprot:scaffold8978_cov140-Skeletonema_marinoi.AAC.5
MESSQGQGLETIYLPAIEEDNFCLVLDGSTNTTHTEEISAATLELEARGGGGPSRSRYCKVYPALQLLHFSYDRGEPNSAAKTL